MSARLPKVIYSRLSAEISANELYRYTLVRQWDVFGSVLVFLMLNPSKADGHQDDPTIRRCVGIARRLGYGGILVCNLFAWRATDPDELRKAADPIGPKNDLAIMNCIKGRDVIAAWGNVEKKFESRARQVLATLRGHAASVRALKLTGEGQPWHPLMSSYSWPLIEVPA